MKFTHIYVQVFKVFMVFFLLLMLVYTYSDFKIDHKFYSILQADTISLIHNAIIERMESTYESQQRLMMTQRKEGQKNCPQMRQKFLPKCLNPCYLKNTFRKSKTVHFVSSILHFYIRKYITKSI